MSTARRTPRSATALSMALCVLAGAVAAVAAREARIDGWAARGAERIAEDVTQASGLSASCRKLAIGLAKAGLLAAASAASDGRAAERELEAYEAYAAWPCPARGLPGIVFGVRDALGAPARQDAG